MQGGEGGVVRRAEARDGAPQVRGGREPSGGGFPVDLQQLRRPDGCAGVPVHEHGDCQQTQLHPGQRHGLRHAELLGGQQCGTDARPLRLPGRRCRSVYLLKVQ